MQNDFQPYSNFQNRNFFCKIGGEIIRDIAPDEHKDNGKVINKILEQVEKGEAVVVDGASNQPGGFGNIDLITLVVIPLLVSTLAELFAQLAIWTIEDLTDWGKKSVENKKKLSQMIDVIVEEKFDEVNKKVKSRKAQKNKKAIRKSVKVKIIIQLGLE